ncbi:MAG: DUF1232 domain-containing protein [Thermomicrobiales bacterium]|nr:DUF1232 domain-containing protein [Thermomicrobiales bacterium]MCO5222354.1 DUF1232 domain-containing protein [Thermomicrobiales bacterium]
MATRTTRLKSMTALWPLFRDPSIPFWAKAAIPAIAAAYVVMPVDLIPDFLIGAGQIDDIGVILLAATATVAFLQKFFAGQQTEPEPARAHTSETESASNIYDATYRVK